MVLQNQEADPGHLRGLNMGPGHLQKVPVAPRIIVVPAELKEINPDPGHPRTYPGPGHLRGLNVGPGHLQKVPVTPVIIVAPFLLLRVLTSIARVFKQHTDSPFPSLSS